MKSIKVGLLLASVLFIGGCTLVSDFGDLTFRENDAGGTQDQDSGPEPEVDSGPDTKEDTGVKPEEDSGPAPVVDSGTDAGVDSGVDAGPPDPCDTAPCDPAAACDSTSGTPVCTCPDTYFDTSADGDGTICVDIDECRINAFTCPDDSTCENIAGGYDCPCNIGFFKNAGVCLDDCNILLSTTCDENAFCEKPEGFGVCKCGFGYMDVSTAQDGSDCAVDTSCTGLDCDQKAECDTSSGTPDCVCPAGYDGDGGTCTDHDECGDFPSVCNADATCMNSTGGFSCTCNEGFTGDGQTCTDNDECTAQTDDCAADAMCTNVPGSFDCDCDDGFMGDGKTCMDIDECALGTYTCSPNADCNNVPASYACECKPGFTGNGLTCTDVDECLVNNGGCGSGVPCSNSPGSFSCGCSQGYKKNASGNCVDIDECADDIDNCSPNANCTNVTTGAPYFTCSCKTGYGGNGVSCIDVDECLPGGGNTCSADGLCNNNPGSYTCMCKPGFTGNGMTCLDVNECTAMTDNCNDTRATCNNVPGTFTCTCITGFSGDGVNCSNIDECGLGQDNCDEMPEACQDTNGSFNCVCPATFYTGNGVGDNGCSDVLECAASNGGCDTIPTATCNEVVGGPNTCTCPGGYMGNGAGALGCADILTCAASNGGCDMSPMATCNEVAGGPNTCTCPNGYSSPDNGVTCNDINECVAGTHNCDTSPVASCTNTTGSFTCTCPTASFGNGVTCTPCTAINNCSSGLTCTTAGNQTCGSCAAGYIGDGTGACTPCGAGTYDNANTCSDCGSIANCATTETCNVTNGTALVCPTCTAGFNGSGTGVCTTCTAIPNCAGGLTCTTPTNQTCGTCAPGTIGDGTPTCTACGTGTYDNGNVCSDCGSIANCTVTETCSVANGTGLACPSCAAGYIGDATAMCTQCGTGTYDNGNVCSDCGSIANCTATETCSVTNGTGLVCPTCAAGYRGNGTAACTACTPIANCQSGLTCSTAANQTCGTCATGYIGDGTGACTACGTGTYDNGNTCTDCGSIANCGSVETCNVTTGTGLVCPTCAAGYIGDGTGTCTACGAGTYDNGNTCNDCGSIVNCTATETCNVTNGTGLACPTCAVGNYGNGTSTCTACTAVPNCQSGVTCSTSLNQTCGACAAGYIGDGTGTCAACGAGTYDNGNVCSDCGSIANCTATETCNVTNGTGLVCPTCAAGYRGNGTATCTACTAIPNCQSGLTCTTAANQTCGTCAPGYIGDGTGACTACGTGTKEVGNACVDCGAIANCSATETCDPATGAGLVCPTCAAGYIGDGTGTCTACGTGTKEVSNACVDCGTIANCTATETCDPATGTGLVCPTCAAGYRGNGTATCTACTPIANCQSGLTCTTAANQTCGTCATGYTGNGTSSCTDINECLTNNGGCDLSPVATCLNTGGSRTCTCPSGYMSSDGGVTCTDIVTCPGGNPACDTVPAATCNEVIGGPNTCSCPAGYTGSGYGPSGCTDQITCGFDNGGCDISPMATCNEVVGGPNTCSCPSGYTTANGGVSCTDILTCPAGNPVCDTVPVATCVEVVGGPNTCLCPSGYAGNGQGSTGCVADATDECTLGTHQCSANATCTNLSPSYSCACNAGYVGNGYVCVTQGTATHPELNAATALTHVNLVVSNSNGAATLQCRSYPRFSPAPAPVLPAFGTCANPIKNNQEFTTWNPLWSVAGVSYTNGNLSISGNTAGVKNARTVNGKNYGKWYWEITVTAGAGGSNMGGIGILEHATPNNINHIGYSPSGMSFGYGPNPTYYWSWTGAAINGAPPGGAQPASSSIHAGKKYMFALDMDTGKFWAGHDGTWYNGGNPEAGTGAAMTGLTGTVYPGVTFYPSSPNAFTANFGQSAFNYAVPYGFNPGFTSNDGAWRTEIRWSYGGSPTPAFSYDYYAHASLKGGGLCDLQATDAAIFAAAHNYLAAGLAGDGYTDPGPFLLNSAATTLGNPFVAVEYNPLTVDDFRLRAVNLSPVSGGLYKAEMWSLRRRFVVSPDNRYILIRRAYGSRNTQLMNGSVDCDVANIEIMLSYGSYYAEHTNFICEAIVVNRAGAGVCVTDNAGTVVIGPQFNNEYGAPTGYSTSDKYMWRHLLQERRGSGAPYESYYKLFSPKRKAPVSADPDNDTYELYLPDYSNLRP